MNARLSRCCVLLFCLLALLTLGHPLWAQTMHALLTHHVLSLEVPFHADRAGSGRLIVDLLSPEDEVLGHSERTVHAVAGDNLWRTEIAGKPHVVDSELVWHRVRCRFLLDGEKTPAMESTETVATILRRPVMRILAQSSYLSGAQAAIRVIVLDRDTGDPLQGVENSTLRIELEEQTTNAPRFVVRPDQQGNVAIELEDTQKKPITLFNGKLDRRGTIDAAFHFPAGVTGARMLHLVAETAFGTIESTQQIDLESKTGILLTTEKPIYQPAQTIHARALALDRADHHAVAGRKLTFELEDSRGNKVFRRAAQTDAYGVASAEFTLAGEVNLGAYHLRAVMGDTDHPSDTQEVTLQVQRYVLPKFRVAIDLAQKNGKPKRDYRPGEHITGTVHANYFFGKPVSDAPINITVHGMDVSLFTAAHAEGRSDTNGDYRFDVALPEYMTGRKQNQGAAPVLIEASVKDSAAHTETKNEPITVSQSPLLITAVPEGGTLVPGIENQVFVLASYPDGTPAPAEIRVQLNGGSTQRLETDLGGIAIAHITPTRGVEMKLHVDADDHHGNRSTNTINLNTRYGEDQVLLRVAHGVYKPGDLIRATVFSTRQSGTAYIDIVKDGQTIQTRDVDIVHGRAELSLRATPQMAGTLSMHTYIFGGDAQTVADHRMIFVQPADELHIQATADAASYLPGSEARVRFHVTNEKGEGVQAALGLEIVDEAVFALAEKQPGFAKVFFYLEEELLKPRFEIHSLSMNDAVVPADASQQDAHDRAARVLFSAAEDVREHAVRTEAIQALPLAQTFAFHDRYQAAYTEHVQLLLQQLPQEDGHIQDLPKRFALVKEDEGSKPHDAWGVSLRVEPVWQTTRRQNSLLRFYNIRSAGPDHRFGTQDDLITMVSGSGDTFSEQRPGAMEWRLEHDRGPLNGRSEITGVITDASGAVIPNASLQLHRIDAAGTWRGTSTKDGSFRFAALTSGRYRLKISASGFASAADEVTLRPQDRAIVTCTLAVGFVTQSVEVATAAAPVVMTQSAEMVQVVNGREFGNLARMAPRAGAALAHADSSAKAPASEGNADHVRSYFPEALYINPEIITDGHGNASIGIPIADSITTWRMAMFASTKAGTLGSGVSSLKVFQDFFVDLDLPVTLTQGDCVSIPVAVYNYTSGRGEVTLSLQQEDWFDLVDDNAEKHVSIDAGKVGGEQFTLRVKRLGKFKLTLAAHLQGESDRKDTVVREIEVVPNGQQQEVVFNGRLESTAQHSVRFPQNALPDASKLFVRLYPGPLSQVIEGMDGILQMPGGCFEQTSSSTYPNVLALDYMKHTKKLTPEVHAKAEGYIANGYQRLLTFEVPGGGFSWFGNTPANKILTAYGLMEFRDMSHVYDVDPRVLERTGAWLAAQQQRDGSWKPDTQFINEGATNRYNSDALRITAYLAWALEGDSEQHAAVEKAKGYIVSNLDSVTSNKTDAYTLAVLANFAVSEDKHSELTRRVLQRLADARTEKGEQAWWSSAETGLYATGDSAAVETTGLAVQALLHSGQYPEIARRALAWILSKKNSYGNWGSTQATIMALRALLLASEGSAGDASGKVQVLLNGEAVQTLNLDAGNNDLLHQFVLPQPGTGAENAVELRFTGSGSMAYQIAGRYFTPWPVKKDAPALSIDVAYDRTHLAQNDVVTATATVHSNLDKRANMVMVDLGIPPGFDLQSEDLQQMVEKTANKPTGRLEKFSLTATQAILYFNAIGAGETMTLKFRLRAKYPIRAASFASHVYEYYDPAVRGTAKPAQLEVTAK